MTLTIFLSNNKKKLTLSKLRRYTNFSRCIAHYKKKPLRRIVTMVVRGKLTMALDLNVLSNDLSKFIDSNYIFITMEIRLIFIRDY